MSFSEHRKSESLKSDPVPEKLESDPLLDPGTEVGSEPLKNVKHERVVQLRVNKGRSQGDAYREGMKSKGSREGTNSSASNLFKREDIKARVGYLETKKKLNSDPAPVAKELPPLDKLLLEQYNLTLTGSSDATRANTLEKIINRLEEQAENSTIGELDPAILAAHLLQFAGWPPERIAQEVGGLSFLASKCCAILKISPEEWVAAIQASSALYPNDAQAAT